MSQQQWEVIPSDDGLCWHIAVQLVDGPQMIGRFWNQPHARACVEAHNAAEGWQPIETAPSNGNMIWVFGGQAEKPKQVYADGDFWAWNRKEHPNERFYTHWKPVEPTPAPPVSP